MGRPGPQCGTPRWVPLREHVGYRSTGGGRTGAGERKGRCGGGRGHRYGRGHFPGAEPGTGANERGRRRRDRPSSRNRGRGRGPGGTRHGRGGRSATNGGRGDDRTGASRPSGGNRDREHRHDDNATTCAGGSGSHTLRTVARFRRRIRHSVNQRDPVTGLRRRRAGTVR
jgi:hypothetical protein